MAFSSGLAQMAFFFSAYSGFASKKWRRQGENAKKKKKKETWTYFMHPEGCDRALQHAVCQFTVRPIAQMIRATVNDHQEKYTKTKESLNITTVHRATGQDLEPDRSNCTFPSPARLPTLFFQLLQCVPSWRPISPCFFSSILVSRPASSDAEEYVWFAKVGCTYELASV